MENEKLLRLFIEWLQVNSPDAWWIYEYTDDAIEQFEAYLVSNKPTP